MKGLIFNIQRYSIHDGGGIRTLVFFKGCPLKCPWCSNPESQNFEPEMVRIIDRCIHCKTCSLDEEECPSGAMTTFGTYMTVQEIVKEVQKDYIFYQTSGGGVTLSGGEVLSQWPFAVELLKELKRQGINTAIETSGQGPKDGLFQMTPYLDTVLYDFKIWNANQAKAILNGNMSVIIQNFEMLLNQDIKVIPRIPLIPGYTMQEENIKNIAQYLQTFDISEVHILPFHQYGRRKYEYLTKEYALRELSPPSDGEVNKIKTYLQSYQFDVVVGGL
ncbi:[formate-C-acetyltransferase]-activating enzyme [Bacillus sp. HMF5848]|uniref:[formate-C-acetyltransferase]-activating enzyme n=1 Tax=Bacillus sp. HMF5848 TaxID=2495421 RepID=UPI000F775F67|nr:[formate-C-acetyltransferase]-activating enzyme [Bacillus sp. HMF5848]RSK25885.1 [formate-C-acetyltransferase]-activating enzyme [Bacillus sp. HMF5848]